MSSDHNDVIIRIDNLSKKYKVGARKQVNNYRALRDVLTEGFQALNPLNKILGKEPQVDDSRDFWALKDVSFSIDKGERVGIIGHNGAGKSTLLKLLSRITIPSTGTIELHGSVSSLLEVGSGFHPELTGRENIYLNGALLGMSRSEIAAKLDEIVDFAEVERFIDTPVKRYSSGMYVRLGFAVAANLEPDILIVDEILAVGDFSFQKKCLGKMRSVSEGEGRTIILVSHNMAAITKLCDRVIILSQGKVIFDGPTEEGCAKYMQEASSSASADLSCRTDRKGDQSLTFTRVELLDSNNVPLPLAMSGQELKIKAYYTCKTPIARVNPGIGISTLSGLRLSSLASSILNREFSSIPMEGAFTITIPRLSLNEGSYSLLVDANNGGTTFDRIENALHIKVVSGDYYGSGKIPAPSNPVLMDFDIGVEAIAKEAASEE